MGMDVPSVQSVKKKKQIYAVDLRRAAWCTVKDAQDVCTKIKSQSHTVMQNFPQMCSVLVRTFTKRHCDNRQIPPIMSNLLRKMSKVKLNNAQKNIVCSQ